MVKQLLKTGAVALFICMAITACQRDKPTGLQTTVAEMQGAVSKYEDSLEQAFMRGEWFSPFFIRLDDTAIAYIFTDSLLVPATRLDSANREAYYTRVRKLIPADEMAIHRLVWQLPEVRFQQHSDGGLYTVATYITQGPAAGRPYYDVEVKRNYYWRIGAVIPIGFLHVYANGQIEVMNLAGAYVSLKERRLHPDD